MKTKQERIKEFGMIDILKEYAWEAREFDLQEFIESGYEVVSQDVNLSVIYEQFANCFEGHEVRQNIKDIFGYYGPGVVLKVEDMHYWLMQS